MRHLGCILIRPNQSGPPAFSDPADYNPDDFKRRAWWWHAVLGQRAPRHHAPGVRRTGGQQPALHGDQPHGRRPSLVRRGVLPARRSREPDQGGPSRTVCHAHKLPAVPGQSASHVAGGFGYVNIERLRALALKKTRLAVWVSSFHPTTQSAKPNGPVPCLRVSHYTLNRPRF